MKKLLIIAVIVLISITGCRQNYYNPNLNDAGAEIQKTQITLNYNSASLEIGDIMKLVATITPQKDSGLTIKWNSSDNEILSVNEEGLITAKKEGTAIITASTEENKATANCQITVVPLKKAIITDKVPTESLKDAVYTIDVKFENCTYPTLKIITDCGGGDVESLNGTNSFGIYQTQLKAAGNTTISFSISESKAVNHLRILCFDNGQIIDTKEYNVQVKKEKEKENN